MDLKNLRYFAEVVRHGSITRAAVQLRVTQPALSRQVRMLEEELGVSLLLRHRRGIQLTAEGTILAREADAILRMAQNMRDEIQSATSEPTGKIRFGLNPSVGSLFAGNLIAKFLSKYPKVTFELREGYTQDLREDLLADRLDLTIMHHQSRHPDLHRTPLFAEVMWLAGAPRLWPFGKAPLKPAQLAGLPLMHARYLRQFLEQLGSSEIHFHSVIEGDARYTTRIAALEGAGFMLAPASSVAEEIKKGELRGAPVEGFITERSMFRRSDRPPSRATREFVEWIEGAVKKLMKEKPAALREIKDAAQAA
jgi:LysR family nitrogen assimilation transcriptional regulator